MKSSFSSSSKAAFVVSRKRKAQWRNVPACSTAERTVLQLSSGSPPKNMTVNDDRPFAKKSRARAATAGVIIAFVP
jgi:hypothetical protein